MLLVLLVNDILLCVLDNTPVQVAYTYAAVSFSLASWSVGLPSWRSLLFHFIWLCTSAKQDLKILYLPHSVAEPAD